MLKFKSLPFLAGAAALGIALLAPPAHANLVLAGGTPVGSFVDLSAQGFGNFPRLLTLQNTPTESGSVSPSNPNGTGDATCGGGPNKCNTPTISSLGWTSGGNVGVGLNTNQTNNTGITLDTLVLTIFNGTTSVGTFSLLAPVNFSATDLALQQGNGQSIFNFDLTAGEQAQFNTILAMTGSSGFVAGLASSFSGSNDGAESWLGFSQAIIPAPSIGDGLPVLLAIGGLVLGARFVGRSKKHRGTAIPYASA